MKNYSFSLRPLALLVNALRRLLSSNAAKTVVSIVLALTILIFLFAQISLQDILNLLTDISYSWIALGAIFYIATNIGRAVRLRALLPHQNTRLSRLIPISITQSMFNNILPSRTGELSLLYFLRKYEGVSLDRGSVALIVARVTDFVAVAMMFVMAAPFALNALPQTTLTVSVIWATIGLMLGCVVGVVGVAWWGQSLVNLLHRGVARLGLTSNRVIEAGLNFLQRLIDAFAALHSVRRYLVVLGWSLVIWITTFAWFYAFMWGIGVPVTALNTVIGSTFAVLSKAIPFISVGGLGAHEAGWTVGFMLVGLDKTLAISSGFAVNILTLLMSVLFGVGSLWVLQTSGERDSTANLIDEAHVIRKSG